MLDRPHTKGFLNIQNMQIISLPSIMGELSPGGLSPVTLYLLSYSTGRTAAERNLLAMA